MPFGFKANLWKEEEPLPARNIIKVDRGGDVTYHGPGQLVSYPIIDLNGYSKSITWYVNILQESIVSALYEYNIKASKKQSPH